MTLDSILDFLKKNRNYLNSEFGVVSIGIFGSYSRYEENSNSDIDIIVEFTKDKKDIHNFLNLRRFLEDKFDRKVDLGLKNTIKPCLIEKINEEIIYV